MEALIVSIVAAVFGGTALLVALLKYRSEVGYARWLRKTSGTMLDDFHAQRGLIGLEVTRENVHWASRAVAEGHFLWGAALKEFVESKGGKAPETDQLFVYFHLADDRFIDPGKIRERVLASARPLGER